MLLVDETEIRRRMTLQIQVETLGRADQKKKAERRKAKYRSQDLSGAVKFVSSYHTDSPGITQGRGGRFHSRAKVHLHLVRCLERFIADEMCFAV